jgi:hypothetical protein
MKTLNSNDSLGGRVGFRGMIPALLIAVSIARAGEMDSGKARAREPRQPEGPDCRHCGCAPVVGLRARAIPALRAGAVIRGERLGISASCCCFSGRSSRQSKNRHPLTASADCRDH